MTKNEINKIKKVAEKLSWNVKINGEDILFSQFSPAGQDFNIEISASSIEELSETLNEYYENYDVSEETYLWLDESGHGRNGAPYDMKDVYEDMEACEEMMKILCDEIEKLVK